MQDEQATETVDVVRGRVARITIQREAQRNALDLRLLARIADAFSTVENDPVTRAVILTGAGDRAFAAGADIAEISACDSRVRAERLSGDGQDVMRRIAASPLVTVAALNGVALGGGFELALACDFRVAAAHARIGMPEVTLGLLPGFGGTQRLVRLVGRSAALRLILLGTPVDTTEALRLGLVDRVAGDEGVIAATETFVEGMIAFAPGACAAVKDAVDTGLDSGAEAGYARERRLFGEAVTGQEGAAGLAAFLARRSAS